MKIVCQAIQAVSVELLGIFLVVWMLFGFASWTLRSVTGNRPTWNQQLADALESSQSQAAAAISYPEGTERTRTEYVSQRLDHYSRLLAVASKNFLRKACQVSAPSGSGGLSSGQVPVSALAGAL